MSCRPLISAGNPTCLLDKDGNRTTARSKGKVERPFRTVKEAHETLYHFHQPETEQQANQWLMRYLLHYNNQRHRSQNHSRLEDWLTHLPSDGLREMCTWEQFCRLALSLYTAIAALRKARKTSVWSVFVPSPIDWVCRYRLWQERERCCSYPL